MIIDEISSVTATSRRSSKLDEFKRLLSKTSSMELGKMFQGHQSKSPEQGAVFYDIGRSTMVYIII